MHTPHRLRPLVALAATLALIGGCQAPVATTPSPRAALAGPHSRVSVDLTAVKQAWRGGLQSVTLQPFETVSQLRLRVIGPGITTDVSATVDWSGPNGGDIAQLTLAVPAGHNRVFVIEGLNAEGHVLKVLRGLGSVTASQPLTLVVNALTDAAGRVLEALLAAPPSGETDRRAALATADITADLLDHVDGYLAYDAAANTYAGAVMPVAFDHLALASDLRAQGFGHLDGPASDAGLQVAAIATHTVRVEDDQGAPVDGADVYVFAPLAYTEGTPHTTMAGEAVVTPVPLGTWSVLAVAGTRRVWGTVTSAGTTPGSTTLTLPAPVVLPDVSTHAGALGVPDVTYRADFIAASGSLSGDVIKAVAAGAAGEVYYSAHSQIWRKTAQGQYIRLYMARSYDNALTTTQAPISDIKAMTVDSAGNLYVAAQTPGTWGHSTYKFSQADIAALTANGHIQPTLVAAHLHGTLKMDTNAMAVHAGKLYLLASDGVTSYDLTDTSGAAPPTQVLYLSRSFTGMAIAGNGDIYLSDTSRHAVYKVTGATTVAHVAGIEVLNYKPGGDATGDALSAARFNVPSALAFMPDGTLLVADTGNQRLKAIDLAAGTVSNYAGSGRSGLVDGATARFNMPVDLAVDAAGTAYVTDQHNDSLRQVASGTTTTLKQYAAPRYVDGLGTDARFAQMTYNIGLTAGPAGSLYLADRDNGVIRQVAADGTATTYAGTGRRSSVDGARLEASFYYLKDLVDDGQGTLYVYDSQALRLVTATGVSSSTALFNDIYAMGAGADGTVYLVCRRGGKYALATFKNGVEQSSVQLSDQTFSGAAGVAVHDGVVYASDRNRRQIFTIAADGTVTLYAGTGNGARNDHADPLQAEFAAPEGLAVDGDRLIVAETNSYALRAIDLTTGAVTTVVARQGAKDGDFGTAGFAYPARVAVTADAIFVTDEFAIRRVVK